MTKKILSVILIVVLMGAIAGGVYIYKKGNDGITYAKEDIENAGFEDGINKYWIVSEDVKNSVSIDTSKDEVYEGSNSLKILAAEKSEAKVFQYIKGLKPGYYYIELYTLNSGNQNACYFYGNGTCQGECMTAIPVTTADTTDSNVIKNKEHWKKVTVRGISVGDDGIMELGVYQDGYDSQYVILDNISIHYENNQESQYKSLYGGCLSWLNWEEDMGAKYYYSNGTEADPIQIMAENGCNFVRLELYNNPGDYVNSSGNRFPEGYKDADDIFNLAERTSNKQMQIELSFMYADYWGNDCIPSDWLEAIDGMTDTDEIVDTLTDCLYNFTKDYMQRLADAGIYPAYVTLGNEMQEGILLPYGCSYTSDETAKAMAKFLNAGYKAVKEVSPDSQIALHIACNGDDMFWSSKRGTGKWFFELCDEYGVNYDLIGSSYYPFWGQEESASAVKNQISVDDIVEWCNMMIDTFDKDILFLESGYNWGTPGQLANDGAYEGIFLDTPEGQRDFVIELINGLKSVKDGRCVGDLYWDPILVRQEGIGWAIIDATGEAEDNCVETTTFFDYDHKALPVLNAYKYNQTGNEKASVYGKVCDKDGNIVAGKEIIITYGSNDYKVITDEYGMYYIKAETSKDSVMSIKADGYSDTAECSGIKLAAGDSLRINFELGKKCKYEAYEDEVVFHYYYNGNKEIYMVFDDAIEDKKEDGKYQDKPAYLLDKSDNDWYTFTLKESYGGFKVVEDLSDELAVLNERTNTVKYEKIIKGYATYYFNNGLYSSDKIVTAKYYIVGSTTRWQEKNPGIFSNYWASNGHWLDELTMNEDGKYEITLENALPNTGYSFAIYENADWDAKMYGDIFTVEENSNVTFIYDAENNTVELITEANN
ncbi:MAG: glycosyl hydrolase 53 family protein [Eubacterium sp.]